jgi:hypothetical protein
MDFLRSAAVFVAVLTFAAPAWAQEPAPVEATRAETQPGEATPGAGAQLTPQLPRPGLPLPTDILAPRSSEIESGNVFKLIASDFKNFFNRDTARVMAYTSVFAVATAPWDREGVNNGFGIPTTLFESGNLVGQFLFQAGAGFASYGIGRASGSEKLATVGRDIVRAMAATAPRSRQDTRPVPLPRPACCIVISAGRRASRRTRWAPTSRWRAWRGTGTTPPTW